MREFIRSYMRRFRSHRPELTAPSSGVFRTITGVVIVQRFHAKFVGGQQVFQQLLHRYLAGREARRVVVSIGRDRLVDKLLHDTHQLEVAVVVWHFPQQLVVVTQRFVIRYHLTQHAVFRRFNADARAVAQYR